MSSLLDPGQIIKRLYDEVNNAIPVEPSGGSLVTEPYDEIDLTYVAAGNGTGQVQTVTYKEGGATVATLTLTYDSADRLIQVLRS